LLAHLSQEGSHQRSEPCRSCDPRLHEQSWPKGDSSRLSVEPNCLWLLYSMRYLGHFGRRIHLHERISQALERLPRESRRRTPDLLLQTETLYLGIGKETLEICEWSFPNIVYQYIRSDCLLRCLWLINVV
jgi:hypothetical protein